MAQALKLNEADYNTLETKLRLAMDIPIGNTTAYSDGDPDDNGDYWVPFKDDSDLLSSLTQEQRDALVEYEPVRIEL